MNTVTKYLIWPDTQLLENNETFLIYNNINY